MGQSMSEVVMQFSFSFTTISRVCREKQVTCKNSNLLQWFGRKETLKDRPVDDWGESFNVIGLQNLFNLLRISMLGHKQVSARELFNGPSWIWAFAAAGKFVYVIDCTVQIFTPHLCSPITPDNSWWLEARCLVWRESFPIVSGEWTCTVMETNSWIHVHYMSTGYCSSW